MTFGKTPTGDVDMPCAVTRFAVHGFHDRVYDMIDAFIQGMIKIYITVPVRDLHFLQTRDHLGFSRVGTSSAEFEIVGEISAGSLKAELEPSFVILGLNYKRSFVRELQTPP